MFPSPTRHLTLPPGYGGTRAVAYKFLDLLGGDGFVEADHGSPDLPGAVTAAEAIGDLPPITLHLRGLLKRGARRLDQPIACPRPNGISAYAAEMRDWSRFTHPADGVRDHVIRYLPRDAPIFREMPNGAEYPMAHATAVRLFERHVASMEARLGKRIGPIERAAIRRTMVPPYPVTSFPNRWWKLRADGPVRTLMAHIGKDTYSHIHYDPAQARVISIREAARRQSFPDGFSFCGTMNPAYRQIGNAVPPMMAKALAESLLSSMRSALMPLASVAAE